MTWNNSFRQREKTLEDKFWEKVDIRSEDECWTWFASKNKKGYGNFHLSVGHSDSKHILAHRMAYMIVNNVELPPEVLVLHTCDNPPCCNPKHLFEGTNQDNIDDMWNKERSATQKGFKPHAKFTSEDIENIRSRRANGERVKDIAESMGVDFGTISRIVNNHTWVDVNG